MKVVEFLGMSRAGKSTQQRKMIEQLQREGYSCQGFVRPRISFRESGSVENFHLAFFDKMRRAYNEGLQTGLDYLFYDRGFHDRIVMLAKDWQEGRVPESFRTELGSQLKAYASAVNVPVLFMISPQTSYDRWGQQIREGLDHSHLIEGLEPSEDLERLNQAYQRYEEMARAYPQMKRIDAEATRDEITLNLLKLVRNGMTRVLNMEELLTPCTK